MDDNGQFSGDLLVVLGDNPRQRDWQVGPVDSMKNLLDSFKARKAQADEG